MCRNLLPFVLLTLLHGGAEVTAQVSEMSLDPLLSFITCVRESKPGYCMRERALGYFETWLTGEEDEDGNPTGSETDDEDEPGSKLSPYWRKMVDQAAERIASFYGEEEDEDPAEGKQLPDGVSVQDNNNTALDARHKKYKKDRRVKLAMTIILLIIYFIVSQLFYMFDKVARTAIFAKLVLAFKIFILVKLVELKRYLWWVKEEKKEVHHEVSLHDHHWDEPSHFDHHYPSEHYGPHPHHYDEPHGGGPWGWHRSADPYRGQNPGQAGQTPGAVSGR